MHQAELEESLSFYQSLCRIFHMNVDPSENAFSAWLLRRDCGILRFDQLIENQFVIRCIAAENIELFSLTSPGAGGYWQIRTCGSVNLQKPHIMGLALLLADVWPELYWYITEQPSKTNGETDQGIPGQEIRELKSWERRRTDAPYIIALVARLFAFYSYSPDQPSD